MLYSTCQPDFENFPSLQNYKHNSCKHKKTYFGIKAEIVALQIQWQKPELQLSAAYVECFKIDALLCIAVV